MSRTLEGAKPGDKIKVMHSWGAQFREYTVDRVTKTRAICGDVAFAIENGLQIGTGDWRRPVFGSFATAEDYARSEQELRIHRARNAVEGILITADNLEAAEAFIAASQPKDKP